eukprot:TRINITY_DN14272_c2_g1_i2.p1 TRINITY_DN14272_c2_g1~~TRINITY_DN14272_c2_g1_i2.p1  ORF type:complete len:308 (+),score=83.07 TRINITY_DN14272_c2_g1_i2:98-1021(+)
MQHRGAGPDSGGKGGGGRGAYNSNVRRDGGYLQNRGFGDWGNGNNAAMDNGASQKNSWRQGTDLTGPTNGQVVANGNGTTVNTGAMSNASPQAQLGDIEGRVRSMQQDFNQALHKVNEKENDKFDLIFSILQDLQSRQAQVEEAVRQLKMQLGGQPTGQAAMMSSPQQGQVMMSNGSFIANGQTMPAQMGAQMAVVNGNVMQQQGMMQDGSQMYPMTQMVVVNGANQGVMYMPQVMSPNGSMQAMPAQMGMQFMGQGGEMSGMTFVSNADGSQMQQMAIQPGSTDKSWNPAEEQKEQGTESNDGNRS